MSSTAYCLQAPLLFVGPYWHLTLPATSIFTYYLVCFSVTFWGSGIAYMLSAVLPVNSVLVGTVFTCLVVGAFLSGTGPSIASVRGTVIEFVLSISYSRYELARFRACNVQNHTTTHVEMVPVHTCLECVVKNTHGGNTWWIMSWWRISLAAHVRLCMDNFSTLWSRWAMEALAITESQMTPSHLQNSTMLFMNQLGVCQMDKMYVSNGDEVLDEDEASALLRIMEFQLSDCTSAFWQCLIWVLLQGILWRILALLGLHFGHRAKKI